MNIHQTVSPHCRNTEDSIVWPCLKTIPAWLLLNLDIRWFARTKWILGSKSGWWMKLLVILAQSNLYQWWFESIITHIVCVFVKCSASWRVYICDIVPDDAMIPDSVCLMIHHKDISSLSVSVWYITICSSRSHCAFTEPCMKSMLALCAGINMRNVQPLEGTHHLRCTIETHATRFRHWKLCWAWQGCNLSKSCCLYTWYAFAIVL